MSSARSYPKRTRHSAAAAGGTIGTGTSYAQRRGGRPRRSTGDIANTTDTIGGDDNENDLDFDFDGVEDGAAYMGSGGGGISYLPSSYGSLPKRRKINALHPGSGSGATTANQRWVKVYRRPMAPTDEPYFGSSPFASFTLPTWVKLQDLTMDERAAYDKLEEEKMKNNTTAKLAQDAGRERESSSDDAVVVVVVMPSAPVVEAGEAATPTDKEWVDKQHETPSSTNVDPSTSIASANPSAVAVVDEGTNTPLMMMNLEGEVKLENTAMQEAGVEDGVSEVPVETSLPKVGEEVNNDMEVANDDTNHGGGNGIDGSIDQGRVDDDPSGYNDAEEEAEGDEDDEDEEEQEEEDDEDKEEGDDDLAQNS
jgi:hypothetical protein